MFNENLVRMGSSAGNCRIFMGLVELSEQQKRTCKISSGINQLAC
jgi:hypothetical protein